MRDFFYIPAEKFEQDPLGIDRVGGELVEFPESMLVGPFPSDRAASEAVPEHPRWGREALVVERVPEGLRVCFRKMW